MPGPYDGRRVHVMADLCSTCVFRPGNLMRLEPGRLRGMIEEARAGESGIVCHKTIHGQREQQAICRGYFDRHGRDVVTLRLALAMNIIDYDAP
jgi:hypothetical protein